LTEVFVSTRLEKENASGDEDPLGAIFFFPLSKGFGVSKGFVAVVGDCSGNSSYSISVSKKFLGSVGYSNSVSLIRAHNLIQCYAKVQIDWLKSNEEDSKQ
jgi:hypothetical protein